MRLTPGEFVHVVLIIFLLRAVTTLFACFSLSVSLSFTFIIFGFWFASTRFPVSYRQDLMKVTSNFLQLGACETPLRCGYPGRTTGSDSICDPNPRGLNMAPGEAFPRIKEASDVEPSTSWVNVGTSWRPIFGWSYNRIL